MSQDPPNDTPDLLALLPSVLLPDVECPDTIALSGRLAMLDQQEIVLALAQWLHENEQWLSHAAFELQVEDGRTYVPGDVYLGPEITDPVAAQAAVNRLVEDMDQRMGPATEEIARDIINDLNACYWSEPRKAWQVLAQHAPVPRDNTNGEAWLAQWRAAWTAADLSRHTAPSTTAGSKRRI